MIFLWNLLSVRRRVTFKSTVIAWKWVNGVAPTYLLELCVPVDVRGRSRLRSTSTRCISLPRVQTSTGQRSFHTADLRCGTISRQPCANMSLAAFKSKLKTWVQRLALVEVCMSVCVCLCGYSGMCMSVCGQWHALDKAEQARYYEMARKEKELHMQLYPGWSARDNYGLHSKKKRKLRGSHLHTCYCQHLSVTVNTCLLVQSNK